MLSTRSVRCALPVLPSMEDYPRTLLEAEERFSSEQACRDYLFRLRWPDGFRCPRCRHDEPWPRSNGLYECARCGLQTSVTAGTIFQDTKKPLRLWFRAIWHVTSQKYGANAWGSSECSVLAVIARRGPGCTNFDAPWCGHGETVFPALYRSMNPTSGEKAREERARSSL